MEKRIAYIDQFNSCWEQLADEYQNIDLDSWVARARIIAPTAFYAEPIKEDVEGEIQCESENYILTWEDGICECVRIYEKV